MAQSFCSYDELRHIVPILTAESTTPVSAEELNPLIERFHTKCHATIQAIGGHSALLSTPEGIAAISFKAGDQRLRIEQDVFSVLQESPSPFIVQCFLSRTDITFMPFISSKNLHNRIDMGCAPGPILSWMFQLSGAIAALETIGLAHGDIKPQNVLVDDREQLTLVDLDHTLPIGSDLNVGEEPYVRAHTLAENDGGGVYGRAGPDTEQFALGSMFWYITRGKELYAELDGFDRVNRLVRRHFPDLSSDDPIDKLIGNCWSGKFERMADLLREIQGVAAEQGALDSISDVQLMSGSEYLAKRELCEYYYSLLLPDGSISRQEDILQ